jgi:hypothetical protein
MIQLDIDGIELKLRRVDDKTQVFDPIRKKWLVLTPEEHVRQYMLQYMMDKLQYPPALISVEKQIMVGTLSRRFDIVVYDRNHRPWMLVECKAPDVPISERTLHQLLQYHSTMQCPYWVLSNGPQTYCADACDVTSIKWLNALPAYKG